MFIPYITLGKTVTLLNGQKISAGLLKTGDKFKDPDFTRRVHDREDLICVVGPFCPAGPGTIEVDFELEPVIFE